MYLNSEIYRNQLCLQQIGPITVYLQDTYNGSSLNIVISVYGKSNLCLQSLI